MRVIKRDGNYEDVSFDKVLRRIRTFCHDLKGVDSDAVAQQVCGRIFDGVETTKLDELAAMICSSMLTDHPDYGTLAARIAISNHQKATSPSFSETMYVLYNHKDIHGKPSPLISDELWEIVKTHKEKINSVIDYERDYSFDYFGFKTLERSYLMRVKDKVVERPQHMLMRVSLGIHGWDWKDAIQTYDLMSRKLFIHATPTLFNAGTRHCQLASCFLGIVPEDSITGIYKNLSDCAQISRLSGGIGIAIHNVRANGSHIRGTNGRSSGIVPMLRVHNATAQYVDQGSRRKGSIAVYIEPWHSDIESFLDLRKNHGNEEERCRDLFTALWIPDLFMKRVQEKGMWSLMCPDECPHLHESYGEAFEELYMKYEADGRFRRQIKAQDLWSAILKSQIETGTPYILFKDSVNRKSNQKNIGVIKSSNLCVAPETEILTKDGYIRISLLEDKEVEVWNGEEWSLTTVRKTNDSAELIKVHLLIQAVKIHLECTPYHKFYLKDGTQVQASELKEGDELLKWNHPSDGDIVFKYKIEKVERTGRMDATYCFNEPLRHMGVFNGILTGNCTEIMEYTDDKEWAVCNLGSIALPSFVEMDDDKPQFNFRKLHEIAGVLTKNLNKVIDRTYYPIPETKLSNLRHRPIGIGVQGLADAYVMMRLSFDSPEASKLNRKIFETIYHGALSASVAITKKRSEWRDELDLLTPSDVRYKEIMSNLRLTPEEETLKEWRGSYATFAGSPASQGLLQYDLWDNVTPTDLWDWTTLKKDIMQFGLRNSLLLAPMPTASTSQILGFNEAFEPFTSNLYQRRTLAGEFIVVNKYLIWDLIRLGLWNKDMKNRILIGNGSIQEIVEIPEEIRVLYKTTWEIKQKILIDQSADRGAFICQSQSLNLFVEDPNFSKLTNMHFYSWSKGLKTGMYYLRTRPKAKMASFTIGKSPSKNNEPIIAEGAVCRMEEGCIMCSG